MINTSHITGATDLPRPILGQIQWFALVVKPKHELDAAKAISQLDVSVIVPNARPPRRRQRTPQHNKQQTLYPGYIFAGFKHPPNWFEVLQHHLIISVVSTNGTPDIIKNDVIKRVTHFGDLKGFNKIS